MKRHMPLLFVAILLTGLVTAVSLAQDSGDGEPSPDDQPLIMPELPRAMIDGVADPRLLKSSPLSIYAVAAEDPSDLCVDAPDMILTPDKPGDGVGVDVKDYTESVDDPPLTCMWGSPSRIQGYRTVWYRLLVPFSGRINFDTFDSAYDTVLGIFSGECGNLTPVLCNDDANGFSSAGTLSVTAGDIYYIEVANWHPTVPDTLTLRFSAILQPLKSLWENVQSKPTSPSISRHSTVSQGDKLYVIGGQGGGEGVPTVSNRLLRLNTSNNIWEELAQIPGAGYSNNTAARVKNRIYVPSGYSGSNLGYDGEHWAYDIGLNSWFRAAKIAPWDLPNGKPFAWAASAVPLINDRYYLMGGITSTSLLDPFADVSRETYVYYPEIDGWFKEPPMQAARYGHTASWVPAKNLGACVAGGLGAQAGVTILHSSAECYQPGGNWRFIGDLNIPRFGAGSATGPDGKWYVFGGQTILDDKLVPVLQTEVYDPQRGTWSVLPPEYNLGGQELTSARSYPSGNFIGNYLYVTGGSIFVEGEFAVALTERLYIPSKTTYLPTALAYGESFLLPDDNFSQARPLPVGFVFLGNFDNQRDFFDFFTFSLTANRRVQIDLEVPEDNNFDLFVYGGNKLLWAESASAFTGRDESIDQVFQPGQYYVVVMRAAPTDQPDRSAVYKLVRRS